MNGVESTPLSKEPAPVVDLFCGAGGLSLGAHLAGFRADLSIDVDPDLTSFYEANFPNSNLRLLDLTTVSGADVAAMVPSGDVAGVVGGPPCQGFSEIGRRKDEDPRNQLVTAFMGAVAAIQPAFFLMENVPGLGDERHVATLDAALSVVPSQYTVLGPVTLDAADFGAATSRRRMVIVGYDPHRVAPLREADLCATGLASATTVRDAISDLPEPASSDADALPYPAYKSLSEYARRMRRCPPVGLGSRAARELLDGGRVSGVLKTDHTDPVIERFSHLEQGARDRISRYPRLAWDRQAPVLRAGTGRDRGSFQAARPIHPESNRVITVREAARLQGFPDWFQFPANKWHSHRMLGNSVSPIFAASLLSTLRSRLLEVEADGRSASAAGTAGLPTSALT